MFEPMVEYRMFSQSGAFVCVCVPAHMLAHAVVSVKEREFH